MSAARLKEPVKTIFKNNVHHLLDDSGKIRKFKPWLGDLFSFMYDRIMERSVFPGKFKGSIGKHFSLLKEEYGNIVGKKILDIASGSGYSALLLDNRNSYTGIDISKGLLVRAARKFRDNNFGDAEFYVADASDMPFADKCFDVAICDLSLNFLGDIGTFIRELKRVLKDDSVFYCSVPVPERKDPKSKIHGNLYSEMELKEWFGKYGFRFIPKKHENGALLYFEARPQL
jgi:ubiquinone/menaquinone biosynthesis C-methylase UbiE